jgi:hypothetical protein
MSTTIGPESGKLTAETVGFVLSAGIVVLLNTVLSCAKDAYAPFKTVMKSLAGHDWTTQGLVDLALFAALGLIFSKTEIADGIAERIGPDRLIAGLVGAVAVAGLGLALWFAFV